jgi:hypothetical protein
MTTLRSVRPCSTGIRVSSPHSAIQYLRYFVHYCPDFARGGWGLTRTEARALHGHTDINPWVKEGEPICPDCGWPLGSVGHEVNCCEEPA